MHATKNDFVFEYLILFDSSLLFLSAGIENGLHTIRVMYGGKSSRVVYDESHSKSGRDFIEIDGNYFSASKIKCDLMLQFGQLIIDGTIECSRKPISVSGILGELNITGHNIKAMPAAKLTADIKFDGREFSRFKFACNCFMIIGNLCGGRFYVASGIEDFENGFYFCAADTKALNIKYNYWCAVLVACNQVYKFGNANAMTFIDEGSRWIVNMRGSGKQLEMNIDLPNEQTDENSVRRSLMSRSGLKCENKSLSAKISKLFNKNNNTLICIKEHIRTYTATRGLIKTEKYEFNKIKADEKAAEECVTINSSKCDNSKCDN